MKRFLQILLSLASATLALAQTSVPVRYNPANKYLLEPLPFLAFPDGGIKIGSTTPALINGSAGGLNLQTTGAGTIILNSPTTVIAGDLSISGTILGTSLTLDPELAAIAGISLNQNQFYARTEIGTGPVDSAITIGPQFTLDSNTLALANSYQSLNTHLTDLSDGTLTGSKVGPGINAANLSGVHSTITLTDTNLLQWGDGSVSVAGNGASEAIGLYTGSAVRFSIGPTGAINIPGDVTIGGVLTADFTADSVDPGDIGPINTSKLLGRFTAGAGTMEEIGLSSSFTLPSGILTLASVPGSVVGTGISASNITTGAFSNVNIANSGGLQWPSDSYIVDILGELDITSGAAMQISSPSGVEVVAPQVHFTADTKVEITTPNLILPAGSVGLSEIGPVNFPKLLGRYSPSSGSPQEITLTSDFTIAGGNLALTGTGSTFQPLNTHLTDLSDGSLTGSKVGTGIAANNITGSFFSINMTETGTINFPAGDFSGAAQIDSLGGLNFSADEGLFFDDVSNFFDDVNIYGAMDFEASGGTINLPPSSVTLSDMANLAQGKLLGRSDSAAGPPQPITVATGDFGMSGSVLVLQSIPSSLDTDLLDLADGSLTGTKVGMGINASNITTGTHPVETLPTSTTFLGSSIESAEITSLAATKLTGTLPNEVLPTAVSLLGQTIETFEITSVDGAKITTGNVAVARMGSGGGTPSSTTFLRGDNTWSAPSGVGLTDGDKGDITVASSGASMTIDNSVITLPKMANLAQGYLLGRSDSSAGPPQPIQVATGDFGMSGSVLVLQSTPSSLDPQIADLADGSLSSLTVTGTADLSNATVSLGTLATLTMSEGSAPATPAANKAVAYVKSDGKFYSKNDAGAETPMYDSGGGGVTDGTWGDITVASGGTVWTVNAVAGPNVTSGIDAANITTGNLAVARMGSGGGTPSSTTFLRGDNSWATPSGGGGVSLSDNNVWTGTNSFTNAAGVSIALASPFTWAAGSKMYSPSDGLIRLSNNAGTGFTRLQLGGTTASFPAIKRSGTGIAFVLADDSDATSVSVLTEAYSDAGWNGDFSVPTKDALRDKIETMGSGSGVTDGDKGDVTISGSGATYTVDAVSAGTGILKTTSTTSGGIGTGSIVTNGGIYAALNMILDSDVASTDSQSGGFVVNGSSIATSIGMGGGKIYAGNSFNIGSATSIISDGSASFASGELLIDSSGGININSGNAVIDEDGNATLAGTLTVAGNTFMGSATPLGGAKLEVSGTGAQQAWVNNASGYAVMSVGSTGSTLLDMTGSGAGLTVNDPFLVGSSLTVSGAVDMSISTVKIHTANDPDLTNEGQISYDANGDVLRAFDGTNQVAIGQKIEPIHVTVISPNDLADSERDAFWIWENVSGMSYVVTGWRVKSDTNNTSVNLKEINADGTSSVTVTAIEANNAGTGLFYGTDSGITNPTIENGHVLLLDFDDTDAPGQVKITIIGYYDANVN